MIDSLFTLIHIVKKSKHKEIVISVTTDEAAEIQNSIDITDGIQFTAPPKKSPLSALQDWRSLKIDGVTIHLNVV